jgi:CRP/FNR family cyclic AMP-dependent transcriptional regulator
MTIRYCRPGALIGAWSLFAIDFAMPATTQALLDAGLLKLSPTVARRLGEEDARVATALLRELSERATTFVYEIPGSAFATVGQRVARHLLDLASEREQRVSHRPGGELMAAVTQQELADAVGTVRSSFFDDASRFPAGTARFDNALIMRSIAHRWEALPSLVA